MIYITGDCHGDFSKIEYFCKKHSTTPNDIMILLGDVGLNYYLNNRDIKNKKKLNKLPLTFLCVQGNHEKYPKGLKNYIIKEENSEHIQGKFFIEEDFPNIKFFINGEKYIIENQSYWVLGGAYSVDKWYRLANSYAWFKDEQMSFSEQNQIVQDITINNPTVDVILSHTCPYKYMPTHLFLDCIDQNAVDDRTERFLDIIEENTHYKKWYCGHFHDNEMLWDKGLMLFEDIIELNIK